PLPPLFPYTTLFRSAIVDDPSVRRPGEAPTVAEVVARLGLLASEGHVLALLGVDAGVDPVAARGGPVVAQVAERLEWLARLVEGRAVLVREVLGRVAVALLQHPLHVGLLLGPLGLVVPHQIENRPIPPGIGARVERLEASAHV